MEIQKRARAILDVFYKPEAIYLKEVISYNGNTRSISGRFVVPMLPSYSVLPINYVTAEQYIRSLSQLSYALIGMLVEDGAIAFASFAEFKILMTECRLYFMRTDLIYRRKILREEAFEITLTCRSDTELNGYRMCNLCVSGAVIRGALHFC